MPNPAGTNALAQAFAALSGDRAADAERQFRAVVASHAGTAQAWHGLGLSLATQGRAAEAVPYLQKAASLSPRDAVVLTNLGLVQKSAGDPAAAIASLQAALVLEPAALNALKGLSDLLMMQGRYAEAARVLRRTLEQTPTAVEVLVNLGAALQKSGELAGALQALDKAIELKPASFEAWTNLGNARHAQGDFSGAIDAHERALAAGAPLAQANFNLATAYEGLKDFDRAIACLDRAIAAVPDDAEAHRNRGLIHLLRGQYAQGWSDYEWRWQCWDFQGRARPFPQPRWTGPHEDGAVLVWGEQGPGDEILYGSMVADLVGRGMPVVWEVDARLVPLVNRALPQCRAVARQMPPHPATTAADIAAQSPVGSLGAFLRPAPSAFPSAPRPYLKADPAVVARLAGALRDDGARRVVGLSWLSKNAEIGAAKSMTLDDFDSLFAIPDVRWVDLQYGDTHIERAALAARRPPGLIHRDDVDLFKDLDGLAALMSACDVVVTVSNTTAHLAGALGLPAIVLVSHGAKKLWYWGEGAAQTPWYPSLTILRQEASGSWANPLAEIGRRFRDG